MRFILISVFCLICCGSCKTNTKALTESLGQEVIEVGVPVKDLPPDIEEEPSAEDDAEKITSTTLQSITKKDIKKPTSGESRRKFKDLNKIDGAKQEDDEARIEKELAEMYKDTADYKSDSAEVVKPLSVNVSAVPEKLSGRMRDNFKFQPDMNNPKDIERFRTSVDEISCERNKLYGTTDKPNSGEITARSKIITWGIGAISVSCLCCCLLQ